MTAHPAKYKVLSSEMPPLHDYTKERPCRCGKCLTDRLNYIVQEYIRNTTFNTCISTYIKSKKVCKYRLVQKLANWWYGFEVTDYLKITLSIPERSVRVPVFGYTAEYVEVINNTFTFPSIAHTVICTKEFYNRGHGITKIKEEFMRQLPELLEGHLKDSEQL